MLNSANRSTPVPSSSLSMTRWLHQVFGQRSPHRVKYRLQGNHLHLLIEGEPCPEPATIRALLIQALQDHPFEVALPSSHSSIYQLVIYGRSPGQDRPAWQDVLKVSPSSGAEKAPSPCQSQAEPLSREAAAQSQPAVAASESEKKTDPIETQDLACLPAASDSQPLETEILPAAHSVAAIAPPETLNASPTTDRLAEPDSELAQQSAASSALVPSTQRLAQKGDPKAIAHYLSETLSQLGIGVRVGVKTQPRSEESRHLAPVWTMAGFQPLQEAASARQRLWITCDAPYSPTPSLLAEPLAQQLRDLNLEGFRDAVVRVQVQGEPHPDWILRIDLTPRQDRLREWARWGDVESLSRLLTPALAAQGARLASATLKQMTLHLVCAPADAPACPLCSAGGQVESGVADPNPSASELEPEPGSGDPDPRFNLSALTLDEAALRAAVATILEDLAPQGIQHAVLYGQIIPEADPAWVQWLDLPAAQHAALAIAPLALAQQEDWAAIAFLLSRVLNPDLDVYLATGGTRVQVLPKGDLLHVMCDAPSCPDQYPVGRAIAKLLRPLNLPSITGVRVYGRRSGQKQPAWSYGADFTTRDRYVPQSIPEFAATDAYVSELITPTEEPIFRPDLTPADVQTAWLRWRRRTIQQIQATLVRSQFFSLHPDVHALVRQSESSEESHSGLRTLTARQSLKVASLWMAVGLLLTAQTSWVLHQWVRRDRQIEAQQQQQALSSVYASAPALTPVEPVEEEPASGPTGGDFREESFIEMPPVVPQSPQQQQVVLASSPILPSADIALSTAADVLDLPTFNSQQLDQKLALYYQRVAQDGPPDVLILGSSRALRGVDPVALSKALADLGYRDVSVFNFGINGATAQVVELVLQRLLTPEHLPKLIIWADGARALNSGREDVTYNGIVASDGYQLVSSGAVLLPDTGVEGAELDPEGRSVSSLVASLGASYQSLDRWLSGQLAGQVPAYEERDRVKSLLQRGIAALLPTPSLEQQVRRASAATPEAARLSELAITEDMVDINGFLPLDLQFNPATYYQEYARVSGDFDRDYDAFRLQGSQTESMEALLSVTQAYDVPVVFVNLPLTDQYLDVVRRQYEQDFKQYMLQVSLAHDQFVFRDLATAWLTEYRYFSDPSHLNRYGAYAVSLRLAQDPMIPWDRLSNSARNTSQNAAADMLRDHRKL
jgi:hypothetical protein